MKVYFGCGNKVNEWVSEWDREWDRDWEFERERQNRKRKNIQWSSFEWQVLPTSPIHEQFEQDSQWKEPDRVRGQKLYSRSYTVPIKISASFRVLTNKIQTSFPNCWTFLSSSRSLSLFLSFFSYSEYFFIWLILTCWKPQKGPNARWTQITYPPL
jgi:hypothetical protein